jgi:TonB family protein
VTSRFFFMIALISLWFPSFIRAEDWLPKRIVGLGYPALAAQARIQGIVTLKCRIGKGGFVESTKIESVSGPVPTGRIRGILGEAAQKNVKEWRFTRSTDDFGSADSTVTVEYHFKLREDGCSETNRKQDFAFEYPGSVFVTSDTPCLQQ